MNWKNGNLDTPPRDKQEVLISVGGIYYLASYDVVASIYRLKDKPNTFFDPSEHQIYWTEYLNSTE